MTDTPTPSPSSPSLLPDEECFRLRCLRFANLHPDSTATAFEALKSIPAQSQRALPTDLLLQAASVADQFLSKLKERDARILELSTIRRDEIEADATRDARIAELEAENKRTRERCELACLRIRDRANENADAWGSIYLDGYENGADDCAEAIRALIAKEKENV